MTRHWGNKKHQTQKFIFIIRRNLGMIGALTSRINPKERVWCSNVASDTAYVKSCSRQMSNCVYKESMEKKKLLLPTSHASASLATDTLSTRLSKPEPFLSRSLTIWLPGCNMHSVACGDLWKQPIAYICVLTPINSERYSLTM